MGFGVWGFTSFEVVSYLIFREKVQEFSPRSPQWLALFEGKKSKSLIQQGLAMCLFVTEEPQNLCGQCFERDCSPLRLKTDN